MLVSEYTIFAIATTQLLYIDMRTKNKEVIESVRKKSEISGITICNIGIDSATTVLQTECALASWHAVFIKRDNTIIMIRTETRR